MSTTIQLALCLGVAASVLAGSPALAGDASDLAARAKIWEEAFNSGDAEAVAALYTKDAMRMPYQQPTIEGRAAIAAAIQQGYEQGIAKIDIELLRAESTGAMAWGHGTYVVIDADGASLQEGKWMNVSAKVGKEWLIQCDIWNTNKPETAPGGSAEK